MYFKRFDNIYYPFTVGGKDVVNVVRDITTNVRFRKAILENITLFDEYDIVDGETPEIIASKVYGSTEYHWVIMMCNQRYDYVNDFPMDSRTLNLYISEKYPGTENATHHYENEQGFVVSENEVGAVAVSNYQYEINVNETKRRIKLISPQLLSQILTQFKSLV